MITFAIRKIKRGMLIHILHPVCITLYRVVLSLMKHFLNWVIKTIFQINCFYGYSHRPEQHLCNLYWKDERTLLIGWADTVKVS